MFLLARCNIVFALKVLKEKQHRKDIKIFSSALSIRSRQFVTYIQLNTINTKYKNKERTKGQNRYLYKKLLQNYTTL